MYLSNKFSSLQRVFVELLLPGILLMSFSGCANLMTTQTRLTREIRNAVTADSILALNFRLQQDATEKKSTLSVTLFQDILQRETFQRQYIEKRSLKPTARASLWLAGAVIASGGYYLSDQTGYVRLGQLSMGGGGLLPVAGEIITASLSPVGEEWREESKMLPAREVPGAGVSVKIDVGAEVWVITTDEQGTLDLDLAPLADGVPFGETMEISLTLADGTANTSYTVPGDIVNAWRTPPMVQFAGTESSTSEDSISFLITIQLSKTWHDSIMVNCWINDGEIHSPSVRSLGSAEPPFYYQSPVVMIPVVIPPGKILWEEYVDHLDNTLDEENRVISLALRNANNAVIGPDSLFSHTVFDDDPPPTVHFSVPVTSGSEALTQAQLPVSLSSPSGRDVSVDYNITGGTAEGQGVDFILETGTLSFSLGDSSTTIEFHIIDDNTVEGEETIVVSLFNPTNATLGETSSHTYIILDNDVIAPAIPAIASRTSQITLAILDFDGIGISAQEALVLSNRLGTHMVNLGTHKIIERGQMKRVLEEQDFQMTGCTSNECAVEVGQLLGCELMLAGSFGKFGSIYTIDMRMIDVATGEVVRSTSYDVKGDVEKLLTTGLEAAVRKIVGVE